MSIFITERDRAGVVCKTASKEFRKDLIKNNVYSPDFTSTTSH